MKLLSKIKKNNDNIKKYIKDCFCIYKMNKMVLHYIECLKVTNNSGKIELRYKIGGINKLYSKFSDCGFKKIGSTDEEEVNCLLKELNINEKIR